MKQHKSCWILLVTGVLILLLAACSPATAVPTTNPDAVLTEAAATVFAQFTQEAAAKPTEAPSSTPAPTNTPVPPTATVAQPTQPPPPAAATNTPAQAASQDNGSFVSDVTVPDGTVVDPGAVFDKTWRIKNTGTTTWSQSYALVYIDGERMSAPESIAMPKDVAPGETVDITVRLTAPAKAGSYQTFFRLRNAGGQFFRLDGSGDLWLKISVGAAATATPTLTATP